MRTYWRQRNDLVQSAARHIQRMQKALTQMNIQLANVLSDVSGVTGQAIIKAILAGERDPQKLASLVDHRVKKSQAQIEAALRGDYRPELLFVLRQSLENYRQMQQQILQCDLSVEKQLAAMSHQSKPSEHLESKGQSEDSTHCRPGKEKPKNGWNPLWPPI